MNIGDIIIIAILVLAAGCALVSCLRGKKGCDGCSGCCGRSCGCGKCPGKK